MVLLALLLFLIALILKLVGAHTDWIQWLLIFGGILLAASIATVSGWRNVLLKPRQ